MMIVPVSWSFQRNDILPIIEAKGESPAKESESIMIQYAVEMVQKASEFKGVPYQVPPCLQTSNALVNVSFSLIFPSDRELANFMEAIQKK